MVRHNKNNINDSPYKLQQNCGKRYVLLMCSGLGKKQFLHHLQTYIFADLSKAYFYFCWCERKSRTSNGCFPADAELQTELCYNATLSQYPKAWDDQSKTRPSQQPTCIFCYLSSVLTRLSQQCAHENQVINGPNFDKQSNNQCNGFYCKSSH